MVNLEEATRDLKITAPMLPLAWLDYQIWCFWKDKRRRGMDVWMRRLTPMIITFLIVWDMFEMSIFLALESFNERSLIFWRKALYFKRIS